MGKLIVVGIGPGNYENMTIKADRALQSCDVIIGYHVYVDLVKERYSDKEFLTTPMTRNEALSNGDRPCKARENSGYGLFRRQRNLWYGGADLRTQRECSDPEVEVIPGLTAACSGAALLGAPLAHDFAVISLSDRLTSWEKIEKRLEAAAAADLSIVLYNPASRGRLIIFIRACDILLRHLPEDRLCGIAQYIGRDGENKRLMPLGELRSAAVDMFCTVFIGNEMTKEIVQNMVTPKDIVMYKICVFARTTEGRELVEF